MPDRGPGKAVDYVEAEPGGGLTGGDHFLSRAFAHAFGFAVAKDARRQYRRVAAIYIVADSLADEVVRDGVELAAVLYHPVTTEIVRTIIMFNP